MKRLFFFTVICIAIICRSQASTASSPQQYITLNLPEAVLADTLTKVLPLRLDTSSNTLQGAITIVDILDLQLVEQKLSCRIKLRGDDLHVVTEISGHEIRLKVGTIEMSFKCDASLRFDKEKQVVYIRPTIQDAKSPGSPGSDDIGLTLLSFLNGREFPVALEDMEPLIAKASNKTVSIQMQIADIRAVKDSLQMSLEPLITTK